MARSVDLEHRINYLDLTQADLDRLANLRPVLEEQGSRLVDAFYRHLLSFPQTRELIRDLHAKAHAAIEPLGADAAELARLCDFLAVRSK